MLFNANCGTTAMGIMPHRDIDRTIKLTLGLDIPFWPQLPHISFYEDMYAQFSQHFPGITIDEENKKLLFDSSKFEKELAAYSLNMADPDAFTLSEQYSVVYHRFINEKLSDYIAIRGQLIGPVSFGFRVVDENNRPIIYNDDVKAILFDFIARKINRQYRELREKNKNAFVWLDEPGLSWVFSGLSGYSDIQAKNDYRSFLSGLESIRALHLCANVNLTYLLEMGTELLSFDAYQMKLMPKGYAGSVARFINSGGIICWGIVPTDSDNLNVQTPQSLADLLIEYWKVISENTEIPLKTIAEQALIAPARCCLKNIGQVGASENVNATEMAKMLNKNTNTLSTMFDRMEAKGLVKKTRDTQDRRLVYVTMTEKGKKTLAATNRASLESLDKISPSFSVDELKTFNTLLEKLINAIEKVLNTDKPSSKRSRIMD